MDLENALGYRFNDAGLLTLALTHPSVGALNNQRLEFLGDAVLELCVSELIYDKYPQLNEGALTARRAALVCEQTLAHLAHGLGLGERLLLDCGEEQTGGREKPSVLADAMEAVLAAVYLDGGQEAARALVKRLYANDAELASMRVEDDKGALQRLTQTRGLQMPEYVVVEETGPAHMKQFTVEVSVAGRALARGMGGTKQAAEKNAARAALRIYAEERA